MFTSISPAPKSSYRVMFPFYIEDVEWSVVGIHTPACKETRMEPGHGASFEWISATCGKVIATLQTNT